MSNAMMLDYGNVAVGAVLIVIALCCSRLLRLQLEKTLLIAACRMVLQLSVIGFVLTWIFARSHWYEVLSILFTMTFIAAYAVKRQVQFPYAGQLRDTVLAIGVASWGVLFLTLWAVLSVHPLMTPQYVIPIGGMILGNTLTGVSLASERFISSLQQHEALIQMRLALSASAWEACREEARVALRAGMMPSINAMMVVGLVSLPGMMTGQILAGADPHQAVLYQIVILFMMTACCALSCIVMIVLMYRRFFNARAQLVLPVSLDKSR